MGHRSAPPPRSGRIAHRRRGSLRAGAWRCQHPDNGPIRALSATKLRAKTNRVLHNSLLNVREGSSVCPLGSTGADKVWLTVSIGGREAKMTEELAPREAMEFDVVIVGGGP